ncbi:MAG: phosphate acyltransferase [Pseudomonadota bacterium]|nr:phosphate acyltransferase [Pseudomonadota bacterium]
MSEHLYREIFAAAKKIKCKRCVVTLADNADQVATIMDAKSQGFISPVFVGHRKIAGMDDFIKTRTLHEAMEVSNKLLVDGEVEMIIQGNENRKQFLSYFMHAAGLRGSITYATVFYDQDMCRTFFAIDPLVAVKPTLEHKIDQVDALTPLLKHVFPRRKIYGVVLAPIETVNPKISATVNAAVLAQMSRRRQFGPRVVIHGPLDVDCALSKVAASRKGVADNKSGNYDFYVLPDTNSAYFFSTFLKYIGRIPTIGVLLDGNNSLLLNSGPLTAEQRLAEIVLGVIASEVAKS